MDFLLLAIHHYLPEVSVNFIIDEELRLLIPPLSREEYKQLEENIVKWGCLDPLKVWPVPDSDEVILLDGHNRFAICCDHNVRYVTESVSLIDRAAAIDWMIANQLGRRNLSAEQVLYLRGMQYQQERQGVSNHGGNNQYHEVVRQNDGQPPQQTAAKLAKQHGVSERTIERSAKYTQAVDVIAIATSPQTRQQILSGELKLTQAATLQLAKLAKQNPAVIPDILEEIQEAPNKTAASAVVQRSISEIEEIPMNKQTARLIDFNTVGEGINWLLGRFTAAEMSEWVTQNLINEEAEALDETEFDEFNDDEEEED
jgi:hypothetical protein